MLERNIVKHLLTIALASCLCGVGCGGSKAGPELKQAAAKSDLDQIQGAWKTMAVSDNGKSTPAEIAQQGKIVVAGEEFAMYEDATTSPQKWRFHLDPTKNPKQIDFTVRGKPALGIYELDGDHWKVAMIKPSAPRPADFSPADRTMVLDLRRGEPAAATVVPADKSADDKTTKQKPSPREMAYGLGFDLSLAAYAYAQSKPQSVIDEDLNKAKIEAKELGTKIPDFPKREDDETKTMAVMTHYVLVNALDPISADLKTNWSEKDATLFELACKTSALFIVYDPKPGAPSMAGLYREDGPKAGLPESVWRPVAELLDAHKPSADVVEAIGKFHAAAFTALAKEGAADVKPAK